MKPDLFLRDSRVGTSAGSNVREAARLPVSAPYDPKGKVSARRKILLLLYKFVKSRRGELQGPAMVCLFPGEQGRVVWLFALVAVIATPPGHGQEIIGGECDLRRGVRG
ncbi:Hypp8624 [Branchiostoma lanceolatum]|uniref:Hypp8624 protein n=1 Tax=Branchiostoma lanceolatum TaxID=7740 RepID=A0A8K0EFA8_BRALA|nr:Hypp8624 [Branchiostoma lanceolatum]